MQNLAIILGCPSDLDGEALLLKTAHTGHRTWRNQVGTDQEASSPLTSSHRLVEEKQSSTASTPQ